MFGGNPTQSAAFDPLQDVFFPHSLSVHTGKELYAYTRLALAVG